jgi:hypothetical protein
MMSSVLPTAGLLAVALFFPLGAAWGDEAELPGAFIDSTYVAPTGQTRAVAKGGDFQAALNAACPGDVITLESGASFIGNFTLPNNAGVGCPSDTGSGWIIVRTSARDRALPPSGTRITPAYASVLPKIVSPNQNPALSAAPGAHHYRFIGVEFTVADNVDINYNLILLGDNPASPEDIPHHLVFDRVYIHGQPSVNTGRGIALNSAETAVVDSYLSDFHQLCCDSQAIAGWTGPGPFKIVNNYLEASTENLLFGGADPARLPGCDPARPDTYPGCLVPSDIEIGHNHFAKPLTWRQGDPSYLGIPWLVKNLLELKNARRVLIKGNLFEHNWVDGQGGTAIVLTVRNQNNTAPWSTVEDITFTDNIVRHTGSGVGMHAADDLHPSQRSKRIAIRNNVFDDVSGVRWGGAGKLFTVSSHVEGGLEDLVIDHNTGIQDGSILFAAGPTTNPGFVFSNNLAPHNEFGVHGVGTLPGVDTLVRYFSENYVFTNNVVVGPIPLPYVSFYPQGNFVGETGPASLDLVGFVRLAGGDYRLAPSSPFKGRGTDGKDVGVDFDALEKATAGVVAGVTNDRPACGAAQPSRALLWPPNHALVPVGIVGVTDPNNDPLTVTITGVTQNEPTNGLGDGDMSPDAVIQGATAWLRAERSGTGNGRVYRISFMADDGRGGTCTGSVVLGVPHSPKRGLPVDNGQLYVSTEP